METAAFTLVIIFLTILQVSLVPLPLSLLAILTWFLYRGARYLWFFATAFSFLLGTIANITLWHVLLSTGLALIVFIYARSLLPTRWWVYAILFVVCAAVWEVSLVAVESLLKI